MSDVTLGPIPGRTITSVWISDTEDGPRHEVPVTSPSEDQARMVPVPADEWSGGDHATPLDPARAAAAELAVKILRECAARTPVSGASVDVIEVQGMADWLLGVDAGSVAEGESDPAALLEGGPTLAETSEALQRQLTPLVRAYGALGVARAAWKLGKLGAVDPTGGRIEK